MTAMILTDEKNPVAIDEKDARDLELKLNVTSKAANWKTIGDALFAFHSNRGNAVNRLVITTEQLEFMKLLMRRIGWEACKDL
jgi:hypothetical protein